MERKIVLKAMQECKKNAKLDYALPIAPAAFIRCERDRFMSYKGIYLKCSKTDKWDIEKSYYLVHHLTEEQRKIVIEILNKYFDVEWNGEENKCILIKDKGE